MKNPRFTGASTLVPLILALAGFLPACAEETATNAQPTLHTPRAAHLNDEDSTGEMPMSNEQAPRVQHVAAAVDQVHVSPAEVAPAPVAAAPVEPPAQPEPEGDSGDSAWGSPDSESGAPLPQRRPMNGSARSSYREGLVASAAGNTASARTAFEQALSADPNAFKAAYALGVISDRAGQSDRALEYYRQSLRIQPDYEMAADGIVSILLRRGATADALAFIEPVAHAWERNLALQALYAEVLVQSERLDDAVTAARAALRRDERFVPAMLAIVKANLKRGRTELATSVLDRALQIDANNAEAHFLKGKTLQVDNRLGEALTEYRRAVELRADYAEARIALGIQFLAAGNYTDAVDQFEKTAALLPSSASVYLNLGDAYRATNQWQKAKTAFDHAIEIADRLPQAHFDLALMYMAAGDQFPGLDKLTALQKSVQEFNTYRDQMGAQLARNDQSQTYLEDLAHQIERETKRLERERVRAERDAARRAREAAQPAAATPAATPAPDAQPAPAAAPQ